MLTQQVTVHILGVHVALGGDELTHAGGVQQGAGAEDFVGGVVVFGLSKIGDQVHRVGDHDQNGTAGVAGNFGHHRVHHGDVLFRQHPAVVVTGLNAGTGSHHDDGGVRAVGVAAHPDGGVGGIGERGGVQSVQHLAQSLVFVGVDHHDLADHALGQDGVQSGAAHHTGANQHQLAFFHTHKGIPPNIISWNLRKRRRKNQGAGRKASKTPWFLL